MPPSRSAVALNDPATSTSTLRARAARPIESVTASSVKEAEEIVAVNAAVLAEEAKPLQTPAAASGLADKGKKHQTYTAEVATEIGGNSSDLQRRGRGGGGGGPPLTPPALGSGLAGPTKYFPPTKMTKIAKY
eukprot:tig00000057_g73.t1